MPNVDNILGTLLVASWLDCGLFALQIYQGFQYFSKCNDPWYMKTMVISLFTVDVVGLAGELATAYLEMVTHFGDMEYLRSPEIVPRSLYLIAVQLAAFQVQAYLITRIQRLTLSWVITIALSVLALLAVSSGLSLSVINIQFSSVGDRSRQRLVSAIWLATSAAVDVFIALTLAYYLAKARKHATFKSTRSTLGRLIANALETGSITAGLAIILLIMFYTLTTTNWPVMFVLLLGRAYSITLMFNLNIRESLKARSTSHTTSTDGGITLSLGTTHRRAGAATPSDMRLGQTGSGHNIEIQVAHSAVTKIDEESDQKPNGYAF